MWQWAELLTLSAFLHILCTMVLNGWPIVASLEDFGGHRSSAQMIPTCSLIDFSEDILCLLLSDKLCTLHIVEHGEPCTLLSRRLLFSGLHVSSSRYWMIRAIQVLASVMAWNSASPTLGLFKWICTTNLWWLFFLVVASRDNASTLMTFYDKCTAFVRSNNCP